MSNGSSRPIVLTLDAGGTNFTFAAMQAGSRIAGPYTLPAEAHDLDMSLTNLFEGFEHVADSAGGRIDAISFAFPGPADYNRGVIDNVGNLPAYAGGVPLADILQQRFGVPVCINNDGDLFAYGEAVGGLLPEVNQRLKSAGGDRRYRNLVGLTLGTGFGGGIVVDGKLLRGDNSLAGEVWLLRHGFEPELNAEEGISIRAIVNAYAQLSNDPQAPQRTPRDIAQIAYGEAAGDQDAAKAAFERLGRALGDAIATVATLVDGLVVIGGGVAAASGLFMPTVLEVVNNAFSPRPNAPPRLVQRLYDLTDEASAEEFFREPPALPSTGAAILGVNRVALPERRLAVGVSRLGAGEAVSLGAYAIAEEHLQG